METTRVYIVDAPCGSAKAINKKVWDEVSHLQDGNLSVTVSKADESTPSEDDPKKNTQYVVKIGRLRMDVGYSVDQIMLAMEDVRRDESAEKDGDMEDESWQEKTPWDLLQEEIESYENDSDA